MFDLGGKLIDNDRPPRHAPTAQGHYRGFPDRTGQPVVSDYTMSTVVSRIRALRCISSFRNCRAFSALLRAPAISLAKSSPLPPIFRDLTPFRLQLASGSLQLCFWQSGYGGECGCDVLRLSRIEKLAFSAQCPSWRFETMPSSVFKRGNVSFQEPQGC